MVVEVEVVVEVEEVVEVVDRGGVQNASVNMW